MVDLRRIELARYADVHSSSRRDQRGALQRHAFVIAEEGLYDEAFQGAVSGWEELRDFIRTLPGAHGFGVRRRSRADSQGGAPLRHEQAGHVLSRPGVTEHVQGTEG